MAIDFKFKIIIVGRAAVGKTSLIRRYVDNKFTESYISTVHTDFSTKDVNYKGQRVRLILYEMGGQEKYAMHQEAQFRLSDYIVAVVSFGDQESIEQLPYILKRSIKAWKANNTGKNPPITFVLNKVDLIKGNKELHYQYAYKKRLLELTKTIKNNGMLFTSAKTGEGVQLLFNKIAQTILQQRR